MTCDKSEPCKFPSPDSCQKRLHPVVGLVLQVGDAQKFPQTLGFESLDLFFFFRVSKQGVCFTAIEVKEHGSEKGDCGRREIGIG